MRRPLMVLSARPGGLAAPGPGQLDRRKVYAPTPLRPAATERRPKNRAEMARPAASRPSTATPGLLGAALKGREGKR